MELTIGIPSYQRPQLIAPTLRKLMAQTWPCDPHFLLVINQPDDGYREALADFAGHPQIDIRYQKQHRGAYHQAQAVYAQCNTEFIVNSCDDDELDAASVSEYLAAMVAHPGIVAAFAPVSFIAENGEHLYDYNAVPETTLIERDDYAGLIDFLANSRHYPELGIYRAGPIARNFAPAAFANTSITALTGMLGEGDILFGQRPFYRMLIRRGDIEHHIGTRIAREAAGWEASLFALDLLFAKAAHRRSGPALAALQQQLRRIHAGRLNEAYHHALNGGEHALALALRKRIEPWYGPILQHYPSEVLAAFELACEAHQSMTWLPHLVVHRLPALDAHLAALPGSGRPLRTHCSEEAAAHRGKALFLTSRQHAPELLACGVPCGHLRTVEALTEQWLPR